MKASLEPFRFSLATPSGIGPWVIAMLTVNGLVGIMAQPHQLAAVGTGKDERTCRVGMLYGNMVKRVCTVGWALVGLIVAAMIAQGRADAATLGDPENAFGFACRQLLFPGALGLMIASILAANMSTCSAFLVDSGALFTEGLYRQRLMPNREDRHYLWVGRISGFVITMFGVLYSVYLIQSVLYTFLLTETLATFVGIGVLGGILWPRANRWGALASLVSALATNFILYYLTGQRLDHWDANVFLAALIAGILALVVVSLATSPEPADKIHSFFARLQASSDDPGPSGLPGGPEAVSGVGAATTAVVDRPLLLVNLLGLRRAASGRGWRAFREDLGGFALAWAIVFSLVGATALFLGM
jgi:Na+/proline symporter